MILGVLLALGFLALVSTLGAYVVIHWGEPLSIRPEAWGQFGDYLGGTLNPFFSFLAFMGLLLTVALQHRELEETRDANRMQSDELMAAREARDAALETQRAQTTIMVRQTEQQARDQKLNDLDKAIRIQSQFIDDVLAVERGLHSPLRERLRHTRLSVEGLPHEISLAIDNFSVDGVGVLQADVDLLTIHLERLGRLLRTYDELQTPSSSPHKVDQWYYTNSWRFKYDSLVEDLATIALLSDVEWVLRVQPSVADELVAYFEAIDP